MISKDEEDGVSRDFVEIDLLQTGSSRYALSGILTIITQIPILFATSYMINGPPKISPFALVFLSSCIQLIVLFIFFKCKRLEIFDVPADIRKPLFYRSLLQCLGLTFFFFSLKHLNPVIALLCMQTGLIALTCGFRIIALQQLFYTVTIGKIKSVIVLMEVGAVPGLEVVDME